MIKYLFQWFYCKSEMGGNISRHYGPFQFSCRRETIEFSRSNIVAGICYENLFCLWIYRQPVRYFDRFIRAICDKTIGHNPLVFCVVYSISDRIVARVFAVFRAVIIQ